MVNYVMKIWPILLLVLAAAGVAAFLFTQRRTSDPAGLTPAGGGDSGAVETEVGDLPPGDVSGGGEPASPPDALDSPASDVGSSLAAPVEVDPKVLLARRDWELRQVALGDQYGGLSTAELRELLARVEQDVTEQRRILFVDRFNRGIYAIQVPGAPPLNRPDPDPRGRLPLQETRTATDMETGRIEAHIATLPIEEYPDLYDLLDERDWLKARLAE